MPERPRRKSVTPGHRSATTAGLSKNEAGSVCHTPSASKWSCAIPLSAPGASSGIAARFNQCGSGSSRSGRNIHSPNAFQFRCQPMYLPQIQPNLKAHNESRLLPLTVAGE